jgi:hypothetical protein
MAGFSVIFEESAEARAFQDMRVTTQHLSSAILASAMALSAAGQTSPATTRNIHDQLQAPTASSAAQLDSSAAQVTHAVEQLPRFTDSEAALNLEVQHFALG